MKVGMGCEVQMEAIVKDQYGIVITEFDKPVWTVTEETSATGCRIAKFFPDDSDGVKRGVLSTNCENEGKVTITLTLGDLKFSEVVEVVKDSVPASIKIEFGIPRLTV